MLTWGHRARRYGRLWSYLARRSLMAQLEYRVDFLVGMVRNAAYIALNLIVYQVMFLHTTTIAGWTEPEVLLLYGTFRIVRGVLYFFVEGNITDIPVFIRSGEMDFILLKPISARFLMTCKQVNPGAISNALVGIVLVIYGMSNLPGTSTPATYLGYLGIIVCAVVIFHSLLFMVLTLSFWLVKADNLHFMFDELLNMGGLPVGIYHGFLGILFSYIIPVGIAATVPAGILAGHYDVFFWFYAPAFAVGAFLSSQWFWRVGVGSYTSAGG